MTSPLPEKPRAMLLDWDNTLVDTWPVIHDAMGVTLAAMGHAPWSLQQTTERVRRSMREAFPEMFGDRWEEARDIFYGRFHAIHLDKLESRPGAEELLSALGARGIYAAVVSNKRGEHLRREAAHLGWAGYFGGVVGAMDAARDKPAVEPVELALAGSGVEAGGGVWFVGDTDIDLQCAHNANCVPVLVRADAPRPGEFGKFGPRLHFSGCRELAALVLSYR
jgi:phosphoglycolate phosphatase